MDQKGLQGKQFDFLKEKMLKSLLQTNPTGNICLSQICLLGLQICRSSLCCFIHNRQKRMWSTWWLPWQFSDNMLWHSLLCCQGDTFVKSANLNAIYTYWHCKLIPLYIRYICLCDQNNYHENFRRTLKIGDKWCRRKRLKCM